jgi:FKBP-type peptidyl-prolyl cis-trans isomerase
MKTNIIITLLFAALFVGCQTYSEEDKNAFDKQISSYLTNKKIDCIRSNSGLYYNILNPGNGPFIRYQDSLTFTYKASLLNGKIVDNPQKEVQFAVKDLIASWKEMVLLLRPGAEVFMISPPQLAYGNHKLDAIPENSILQFEMKILGVK